MTKTARMPRLWSQTLYLALLTSVALASACAQDAAEVEQPDQVGPISSQMLPAATAAREYLIAQRDTLGLDADHDFRARLAFIDELGQTHVRMQQLYRGVPIWASEAIVHQGASGNPLGLTSQLRDKLHMSKTPTLTEADARAVAHRDLAPRGRYAAPPTSELVIYPVTAPVIRSNRMRGPDGKLNAVDVEDPVSRYALAYHVHSEVEDDAETSHTDYIVDAQSGDILKRWSTLQTASANGTGNSQHSGVVSIQTNTTTDGYELRDVSRSMNFATYNLNHATSSMGSIYKDSDNTWGDGANYVYLGSTTNANGQTAAVDAHFGMARTFDYYMNVHGRNGIDGAGTSTYNRVHYSTNYGNAFWSDTCFCMTYGDGNTTYRVLTSVDVAGHELTHGVITRTANLTYSGESGGLNEALADIHGTLIEFYARGGSGSTIGETGGNWLIGEQLGATPLRYMYKPSLDGNSVDAWYSGIGGLDVHYSSGPMNRAFYFLSQGASSNPASDYYSSYLPAGMTGIGNDKAARILFRALITYMTPSTNYSGARTAYLSSATDLYGAGSTEVTAVANAFAAINVGLPGSFEVEPNNSISTAQLITPANNLMNGTIATSTDQDYYRVDVNAGNTLIATLTPNSTSNYDVFIFNGSGSLLAYSFLGTGSVDVASVKNTTGSSQAWYVSVRYQSGKTGSSGAYTLNLTF